MTNGELLEKAYRDYPIGTKFVSWDDTSRVREIKPYPGRSEIIWSIDNDTRKVRCNNGMFYENPEGGNNFCSNPHIYYKGEWAKIIQPEELLLTTIL